MGSRLYRRVRHALANRGLIGSLNKAIQRLTRTLFHKS
jgi:hypothetical protein